MIVPKSEIQRWRETFPILMCVDDQQIAKFIAELRALLEPRWKKEESAR